jgi:hypothetical protein
MEEEYYSNFIFLSEDAKENLSKLSDSHLNAICSVLHQSIIETQHKIEREMNGEE